jgi:hypothetical protein
LIVSGANGFFSDVRWLRGNVLSIERLWSLKAGVYAQYSKKHFPQKR